MTKTIDQTILKSLRVAKFRGLEGIEIPLGKQITLICGKNGTSKSSLPGVAAQIFSFEYDFIANMPLTYKTITGNGFKSYPSEHFRFSDKFDGPSSMSVDFDIFDGYTKSDYISNLELTTRTTTKGIIARPVVRKNTSLPHKNTSRNYTHPVIYLSLNRLMPITMRQNYEAVDYEYLEKHREKFISLNNELLNKISSSAIGTKGSISSAVAFGENYNQDSVSTGEDNAGQIVLALMSFHKLKSEYAHYKGGLLLIDEADAGLFPAAQIKLIQILHRECNELGIQVIMTSHSPSMIEHVYEESQKFQRNYKNIYLTDTYGKLESLTNASWPQIYADLHTQTYQIKADVKLPVCNVYFEDSEAEDFFNALMLRHPAKKIIKNISNVTLGCDNYIQLVKSKVEEFSKKSIIVLDADARSKAKLHETIITLPGILPPDQLIFEFLYNIPANDPIWRNNIHFTRPSLISAASDIISILGIRTSHIKLSELIAKQKNQDKESKTRLRVLFKKFYKNSEFQKLLKITDSKINPWKKWILENPDEASTFRMLFVNSLRNVLRKGHGVDPSKAAFLLPKSLESSLHNKAGQARAQPV